MQARPGWRRSSELHSRPRWSPPDLAQTRSRLGDMTMRCYGAMSPAKRAASSFGGGRASTGKKPPAAPPPPKDPPKPAKPRSKGTNDQPKPTSGLASPFIDALADLLRSRNIEIPPGLLA